MRKKKLPNVPLLRRLNMIGESPQYIFVEVEGKRTSFMDITVNDQAKYIIKEMEAYLDGEKVKFIKEKKSEV